MTVSSVELGNGSIPQRFINNVLSRNKISCPEGISFVCNNHETSRAKLYTEIYENMYKEHFGRRFPEDAKLLEFGIGPGEIAKEFSRKGLDVFGTDIEPRLSGKIVVASNTFPYVNDTFDLISATSVLHHVPEEEHKNYFTEFKRVLKPEGAIFIQEDERGRNQLEHNVIRVVDRLVSGPEADSHKTDYDWRKFFEVNSTDVVESALLTHELGPIRLNKLFYLIKNK
jgi:SAM-dependent methyltransferase